MKLLSPKSAVEFALPSLSTLLPIVGPSIWAVPLIVVLGMLSAAAEGASIGLLIPLLNEVYSNDQLSSSTILSPLENYVSWLPTERRVLALTVTVFGLLLVKAILQFSFSAISLWFSGTAIRALRSALFGQLLHVGYSFFPGREQGRLYDIVRGETWLVGELLVAFCQLLISICTILAFGILLISISWQLSLLVCGGVLAASLLIRLVMRDANRFGHELMNASAALTDITIELLGAMRLIRLFGQERREQERFDRALERSRAATFRTELAAVAISPLTEVLYAPIFLFILLFAWSSQINSAEFTTFLVLLYRLQPHIRRIAHFRVQIATLTPALAQTSALLSPIGKPYIEDGSQPYEGLRESIKFARVSFTYCSSAGESQAIKDVSFEIRRNKITAIVGESGAGKSTIVNLLCRLYDPDRGDIIVDGTALQNLCLSDWRGRLAVAGQDTELLGDTIYDAIAYGRASADHAAVIAAARQAHVDQFLEDLPNGLSTKIGGKGLQLSAGQRQRIGLARALLRSPEILILDEATNALDSLAESSIENALAELAGSTTMIVIAHRLSTVRRADHIVVLKRGRIIEQGRPDELLQNEGLFAALWSLQSSGFQVGTARLGE